MVACRWRQRRQGLRPALDVALPVQDAFEVAIQEE